MKYTELLGTVVKSVDFKNELKNGERIQLTFGYQYNVKYSPNGTCRGEFVARAENKDNPKAFHIHVSMIGTFKITDKDATREELHVETYDQLFPYVRAFIGTLTASCGIPPVVAKYIDISGRDIYQFNMDELNRQADEFRSHHDDNEDED